MRNVLISMNVDEFVETKVLPEFRPIVALLRELLHEMVPDVEELIYYGQPMYRRNNLVFSRSGIALGFRRGADFEDKFGLLEGQGKWARNIIIKSLDAVNREALRYYIRQALELDSS